MATKVYSNSSKESVARAKYGDAKVNAALSKAWYSTWIKSPWVSTSSDWRSSINNTQAEAPVYKTANWSQTSINKWLAKYWSLQAMEAALNKQWYTLWTTVLKTKNVYSPGWVSSNTDKWSDLLASTLKTNDGVSSVDKAINDQKIIDIKTWVPKNENLFAKPEVKDLSIKARDIW